ncbi:sulfatase-like hydrolase/transferase [Verrucomicrobiota bacterium]
MKRREFLKTTCAGAAAVYAGCVNPIAAKDMNATRKNIVLIMADDLGYECIGSYGSTYKTPVLDNASKEGVFFNHAYSQPLCTPSRVQIMTGRYNHRNYVSFGYLDPKEKTFGNVFKDAGYKTCIAGKWQLSGDAERIKRFGFDEHCLWSMKPYGPGKNEFKDFELPKNNGSRYQSPVLYKNGQWFKGTANDYGPTVCCDFILDFIEKNKVEPFFVYYPMILTHSPFPATPDSPDWQAGKEKTKGEGYFSDMVTYTDKICGRIEAKLKELGLFDNTVIMFTGDNGTNKSITIPMKDGSTIRGGKGSMHDAGTRVPLIVWGGGMKKGVVTDSPVDFSDFFPTCLDIAGVPVPAKLKIDGTSFKPVLTGEKNSVRDAIFCYYDPKWGKWEKQVWARNIEYKLYSDGRFYCVKNDVSERNDLNKKKLSEKQIAIKKKLQQVIDKYLGN